MTQYIRQKGDNKVFAIINGGAYYVDYDYALKNNVFPQVQEVSYRVDTKYPLSGPIRNAPVEQKQFITSEAREGDFVEGKGTMGLDGQFYGSTTIQPDSSDIPEVPTPKEPEKPQGITGVSELDSLLERMYKMLEDNLSQ